MLATKETPSGTEPRIVAARSTNGRLTVRKVKAQDPVVEPPAEPPTFGAYLIAAMDAKNLDGATLSRLTGPDRPVDSSTISNLRNDNVQPGIKVLTRLAPHLGKTVGELLLAAGLVGGPEDLIVSERQIHPVLQRIQDLIDAGTYADKHLRVLLRYVDQDTDRWLGLMEQIQEDIAEALRGRR